MTVEMMAPGKYLHIKAKECERCKNLLCSAESQLEVVFAFCRGEGVVVELSGEERVH